MHLHGTFSLFYFVHIYCMLFCIYISLLLKIGQSCCLFLYTISRLACCLHSFYRSVCGQFDNWFFHLEISMFVYEFLYARNRLRIPPCFLLLQNLLASAHCHLCLNACYAYQLLLGRFLLFPLWCFSPPALFLYH